MLMKPRLRKEAAAPRLECSRDWKKTIVAVHVSTSRTAFDAIFLPKI